MKNYIKITVFFIIIASIGFELRPKVNELIYIYQKTFKYKKLKKELQIKIKDKTASNKDIKLYIKALYILHDKSFLNEAMVYYPILNHKTILKKIIFIGYKQNKVKLYNFLNKEYTKNKNVLNDLLRISYALNNKDLIYKNLYRKYKLTKNNNILMNIYNLKHTSNVFDKLINNFNNLNRKNKLSTIIYLIDQNRLNTAVDFSKRINIPYKYLDLFVDLYKKINPELLSRNLYTKYNQYSIYNRLFKNQSIIDIYIEKQLSLYKKTKQLKYLNLALFNTKYSHNKILLKEIYKLKSKNSIYYLNKYVQIDNKAKYYLIKLLNKNLSNKLYLFNIQKDLLNMHVYKAVFDNLKKRNIHNIYSEILFRLIKNKKVTSDNSFIFKELLLRRYYFTYIRKKYFEYLYKNNELMTQKTYKTFGYPNNIKRLEFYLGWNKKFTYKTYLKYANNIFLKSVIASKYNLVYEQEKLLKQDPLLFNALLYLGKYYYWHNKRKSLKYLTKYYKYIKTNYEVNFYLGELTHTKKYYIFVIKHKENNSFTHTKMYLISMYRLHYSTLDKYRKLIQKYSSNEKLTKKRYKNFLYFLTTINNYKKEIYELNKIKKYISANDYYYFKGSIELHFKFYEKAANDYMQLKQKSRKIKIFLAEHYFYSKQYEKAYRFFSLIKHKNIQLEREYEYTCKKIHNSVYAYYNSNNVYTQGFTLYKNHYHYNVYGITLNNREYIRFNLKHKNYSFGIGNNYFLIKYNLKNLSFYIKQDIDQNTNKTIQNTLIYNQIHLNTKIHKYFNIGLNYFRYNTFNRKNLYTSFYYPINTRYFINYFFDYENSTNNNYGYKTYTDQEFILEKKDYLKRYFHYKWFIGINNNKTFGFLGGLKISYQNKNWTISNSNIFSTNNTYGNNLTTYIKFKYYF